MIPPVTPGQAEEKQNMVSWKNTFSMRQISLMNLAASQLGVKNGSRSAIPNCRRTYSITSPAKSLDLLRKNLQSAINKDIDTVIRKYLEKFFQPAINNIKINLGKDSVTEDHLKEVCKQMLEDAKLMYKISPGSRDSSPYDYSDSEASTTDGRCGHNSPLHRKRKESDTDSETNNKRHKSQFFYMTECGKYKVPIKREGIKWNPDRITENTLFIMGPRANKVLGYGQTRGRLYARHPDLVRYSGDQEDKEWLSAKNLMPPSGGKAYLMILEDIKELTESDEYKNNPNLQLHELKGFIAPQFLVNKVKLFIQNFKTDKKPFMGLDLFDFRSQSITPPNTTPDSGPSTPSDSVQVESQSGSTSSKQSENNFVNIPEMSPNSNHSIISSQSPIQNSGLLSPNMLMTIANHTEGGPVMILKENTQNDTCLSSILASDNSQDF
ncbi:deoxynucleotidyltransferase terminal-interacting protein 1 [Tribolium castaneum]|uniref:Deoxynucleotidyltransferase terminal-interacting protein 1-like Protein n=1 Tax=Tribolium castaneum TaxID=7070 RepID=D6X2W4_TRICA|nr:PREDICTED: deoxynucleotidyltransferase terminal-interacting protein 1 [Tribolium castaneum]EFA10654.1 Deoxynucleotidyltransferase terminal-interacting protein 1-like Protein [Tribolium castaneum]|eukprot:XP_008199690.1 PREDICTED: deoxynucleotidyltransferase terminal-interacting protein 1 [Tribolium castaneum]